MTSLALQEVSIADAILSGAFRGYADGLPAEVYHAAPYYSNTFLGHAAETLAEGRAYLDGQIPNAETAARRFGTLVHAKTLERDRFQMTYTCGPRIEDFPGALRTGEDIADRLRSLNLKVTGKKAELIDRLRLADPGAIFWDEILARELKGKTLVDPDEYERVCRASDALLDHPKIGQIILAGHAERSYFWTHRELGIPMKARLDVLVDDPTVILDIKTYDDLTNYALERHMRKMHYDWQEIVYTEAVETVHDLEVRAFANAFTRTKAPFLARRAFINQESRERARGEVNYHLERVAKAHLGGPWTGYEDESEEICLTPF